MEEVVRVESVTKAYGSLLAVDHVSLSVKRGTAIGLLGANGAGKSTTIECILGTKRADGGTVSILSLDPQERPPPSVPAGRRSISGVRLSGGN